MVGSTVTTYKSFAMKQGIGQAVIMEFRVFFPLIFGREKLVVVIDPSMLNTLADGKINANGN
jgi:hypothetical protein